MVCDVLVDELREVREAMTALGSAVVGYDDEPGAWTDSCDAARGLVAAGGALCERLSREVQVRS
jgi:hypothetical protein